MSEFDLEQAARLRIAVARVSRRLRSVASGEDMSMTDLLVLAAVVRNGPLRLTDLALAEAVNPSMLSRIVAKLNRDGLLTRTTDPNDRRVVMVDATTAGCERNERVGYERTQAMATAMRSLDPAFTRALSAAVPALEELGAALQNLRE